MTRKSQVLYTVSVVAPVVLAGVVFCNSAPAQDVPLIPVRRYPYTYPPGFSERLQRDLNTACWQQARLNQRAVNLDSRSDSLTREGEILAKELQEISRLPNGAVKAARNIIIDRKLNEFKAEIADLRDDSGRYKSDLAEFRDECVRLTKRVEAEKALRRR